MSMEREIAISMLLIFLIVLPFGVMFAINTQLKPANLAYIYIDSTDVSNNNPVLLNVTIKNKNYIYYNAYANKSYPVMLSNLIVVPADHGDNNILITATTSTGEMLNYTGTFYLCGCGLSFYVISLGAGEKMTVNRYESLVDAYTSLFLNRYKYSFGNTTVKVQIFDLNFIAKNITIIDEYNSTVTWQPNVMGLRKPPLMVFHPERDISLVGIYPMVLYGEYQHSYSYDIILE